MASPVIQIALSEPLDAYVRARVESGNFGTPAEYLRELIRDDRDRRRVRIEENLLDALNSEPVPLTEEEWQHGDLISLAGERLGRQR